jgi:hypothetical protein
MKLDKYVIIIFNMFNYNNLRPVYIFARFRFVRLISKQFKIMKKILLKNKNRISKIEKETVMVKRYNPIPSDEASVNFKENNSEILNQLEIKGLHTGINLKNNVLDSLLLLSKNSPLKHLRTNTLFSNLEEVNEYNKDNNKPCCLVELIDANSKKLSELDFLIDKISRDKNLMKLANNYLGKVSKIYNRLSWTTVCNSESDWREKEHTVSFHYDVHDYGYVYAFFYLTDCDKMSGAHELILGSHRSKSFKHLITSVNKFSENELQKYYSIKQFKIIEGNAGSGFIEDTSAFHKLHAPKTKPRLALQIRYH